MNLPNKLTLSRVFATPLILVLIVLGSVKFHFLAAFLLFSLASITDLFDGKIARKRGLVTNFGKLMDPLADKMMVTAALIGLLSIQELDPFSVFIVLFREFFVTSMRLIAAGTGVVIAADKLGKYKTTLQIFSLGALLLLLELKQWHMIPGVLERVLGVILVALWWGAVLLTIISGVQIFLKSRQFFMKDL